VRRRDLNGKPVDQVAKLYVDQPPAPAFSRASSMDSSPRRVKGSPVSALRLGEEKEKAEIIRLVVPIDAPDTYTEIAITELHEPAQRALTGRRLADYLSAELRGSMRASGIAIDILDGVGQALAQKRIAVVPRRFTGERRALPDDLDVPDHAPVRLELYLARGEERPAIQVSCAGTLVADDLSQFGAFGLGEPPWTEGI
jgi:hypothetical protein